MNGVDVKMVSLVDELASYVGPDVADTRICELVRQLQAAILQQQAAA